MVKSVDNGEILVSQWLKLVQVLPAALKVPAAEKPLLVPDDAPHRNKSGVSFKISAENHYYSSLLQK